MSEERPSTADWSSASSVPGATNYGDVSVPLGDVFDVLSARRRRFVLYLLAHRGGTVPVDELAAQIAAHEQDTDPSLLDEAEKGPVTAQLYHAALPKLSEHGFVEYDRDAGAVTLNREADGLRPCLQFAGALESDAVESLLGTVPDR